MAPIGVIIFISLLMGSIFVAGGCLTLKLDKGKGQNGLILISLGIGLTIAFLMWGINRSNCMGGSREYGKKSMTYSNGKVHYYTPRSSRAIYCDDTEGYTFGYVIKYTILISGLAFAVLYVIKKDKKYTKYVVCIGGAIGTIVLLSTLASNNTIRNKTEEFIQLDEECCIDNDGEYYIEYGGQSNACDLTRYKDKLYGKYEYTNSRIDDFKAYKQCRQNAIDSIFEGIDHDKVDIDFYL